MNAGSLFTGIGGFDLGLERAGMSVLWQCEIDEFCRLVLEKHWPEVTRHRDIRDLHSPEPVELLHGGFPCQDVSVAGRGAGVQGARTGLWVEFARVIGVVRPKYVVVENVIGLRKRGLGQVLGDLAALGYDAEWDCLPASVFGAPHSRDRIWIVAYPRGSGRSTIDVGESEQQAGEGARGSGTLLADSPGPRLERHRQLSGRAQEPEPGHVSWWSVEPPVGRMAHGVPFRVDRIEALGNAIVPQIAEWIGRRILAWEGA